MNQRRVAFVDSRVGDDVGVIHYGSQRRVFKLLSHHLWIPLFAEHRSVGNESLYQRDL